MSLGASSSRRLRPELNGHGSRALVRAVKPSGGVTSPRGRRVLGWALLVAGLALVGWAWS